jgi:hypothetical protein
MVAGSMLASASADAAPIALRADWQYMANFKTIRVRLENHGQSAVCIPEIDTKERISFRQKGTKVAPLVERNRALMIWRGADLIGGFVVVPPAKHVDLYYTLTDWDLHPGSASAEVNFPVYDCVEFFQTSNPRAEPFTSSTTFVLSPPER